MNTKNNKRRKESIIKIQKAFVELLQEREIKDITVSDICKMTGLNRSTFYANYIDIYDLAHKVKVSLENEFSEMFSDYDYYNEHSGALKMFTHIKENQIFYKTYFKLCSICSERVTVFDEKRAEKELQTKNIKYHIEFFRNGLNAIIMLWLSGGCEESPEEMAEVLKLEYKGR